jgi:type IV secretion system protein VirB6
VTGFFTNFWNFLQGSVLNTVSAITSDISASLEPAVVTFATIYVMVWGYLHLRGAIEEPIMEAAKRIVMLGIIMGIVLSLWSYNDVFVDFFVNTPQELSSTIISGNTAISTVDGIWLKGGDVAGSLLNEAGIFKDNGIEFYIAGFAVYAIVGIVCIWVAYLFSLSIVGVGILLAIGPLFILGLLFDSTKRFFEAWIAQLSNYALIIVIAAIASKLLLAVLDKYATDAQALGAGVTTAQAMQLCIACGFIGLIMKQVPSIAAGLASGIALSSYNALSRSINWAAGGTGRSLYQFSRGMGDAKAGEKPSRYLSVTRNLGNRTYGAGKSLANAVAGNNQTTGGKIARNKVF